MKKLVAFVLVTGLLVPALAACGAPSLSGTNWKGFVGTTEVTVQFRDETHYTCRELGDGTYSINSWDGVTLQPSGEGQTLFFLLDYDLMVGTDDELPAKLKKQ